MAPAEERSPGVLHPAFMAVRAIIFFLQFLQAVLFEYI